MQFNVVSNVLIKISSFFEDKLYFKKLMSLSDNFSSVFPINSSLLLFKKILSGSCSKALSIFSLAEVIFPSFISIKALVFIKLISLGFFSKAFSQIFFDSSKLSFVKSSFIISHIIEIALFLLESFL